MDGAGGMGVVKSSKISHVFKATAAAEGGGGET